MSWLKWFKVGINVAEDVLGPTLGPQKLGVAVSIVQAIAGAMAAKGTVAMGDAHDNLMITTGVQDTFNKMKAAGEPIGTLALGRENQPDPVTGKAPYPPVSTQPKPTSGLGLVPNPNLNPNPPYPRTNPPLVPTTAASIAQSAIAGSGIKPGVPNPVSSSVANPGPSSGVRPGPGPDAPATPASKSPMTFSIQDIIAGKHLAK